MRKFWFVIFFTYSVLGFAQHKNLPLNKQFGVWEEANINHTKSKVHSGMRPILETDLPMDSLALEESIRTKRVERKKLLGKKLKQDHFIDINKDDYRITIDPLGNFEKGFEQSALPDTQNLYKNTRGILVQGDIGPKLSFSTSFYESQAYFPSYLSEYISENGEPHYKESGLIPGQGRAKPFKNGGFDYGVAQGYASYSPSPFVNIQLGHGKHFIGEGYRSLLLSDNAFNYPYVKVTSKIGKRKRWQYTNIYNTMLGVNRLPETVGAEAQIERKAGTFHYLSWIPTPIIQVGLFEGTIWQTWDSTGAISPGPARANPVIGGNSMVYGINGNNNTVFGLNLKITPLDYISLYAQTVIDGPSKSGYQLGAKIFDLGGLIKNLSLRMEYNTVSKYTYAHSIELQNYGHLAQPIAHTLGAGFKEGVAILNYTYRDIFFQGKYIVAQYPVDTVTYSVGKDIFNFETNNSGQLGSSTMENLTYADIQLGYMINRKTSLNMAVGMSIRSTQSSLGNTHSNYIYLALRTSLRNIYYDF